MRTPLTKTTALGLALAAMVFRALLPVGWMPSAAGTHAPTLVLCTLDGPRRIAWPDPPAHPKNHEHAGGVLCAFAAAVPFAAPSAVATILPRQAVAKVAASPAEDTQPVARLPRNHAPRGPPARA